MVRPLTAPCSAQLTVPRQPLFNPFAGIHINLAQLTTHLPPPEEWDRKTVISVAKECSKGMNKKEKARLKKQLLLKKLEATKQLELDLKVRKRCAFSGA